MSGAFSADLENPPYFVQLPLDPNAEIIPEVWSLWMDYNPSNLISALADNTCHPRIYFDIGTRDEFHGMPACDAFAESLSIMGIGYEYQVFNGGHFDKLGERFPIAITSCVKR